MSSRKNIVTLHKSLSSRKGVMKSTEEYIDMTFDYNCMWNVGIFVSETVNIIYTCDINLHFF